MYEQCSEAPLSRRGAVAHVEGAEGGDARPVGAVCDDGHVAQRA